MHGRLAAARCTACVAACPTGAFELTDDSLAFDAAACTGCGVCRPACPEAAIDVPGQSFVPMIDARARFAYFGCTRAVSPDLPGAVPCLHALGDRHLEALRKDGIRALITTRGDCDHCMPQAQGRLEAALQRVNLVAVSHGGSVLRHDALPPAHWRRQQARVEAAGTDLDQRRRGLFSLILTPKSQPDAHAAEPGSGSGFSPLYRFVPRIAEEACCGCDACARLCNHGAIVLVRGDGGLAYRIDAAACTGCRLCVDVCKDGAVSLDELAEGEGQRVPLDEKQCGACGAPYHEPSARSAAPATCRICSATNHHQNLFQVRP